MKGAYGDPENTGVGYNTIITELGDHSVPKNWEQFAVKRGPGETPGPPIIWSDPQDPEDAQPGYGYIADDATEEETFFYHSDHLGSTSYITDDKGNITQYTVYLPYGELLVDEHSSSEDLPYKFNGKELDEKTGLYYYGARYLNPVSSVWYGVDPLAEKMPAYSAYVYCAGNPVRRTDVDGRDWVERTVNGVREIYYDRDVKSQRDINRLYGSKSGISHIADKTTMTLEGNRYTFYNDKSENKYGRVAMNGRLQDNASIIRGEGFDIFGTADNSCDARTLHRNLMGTSYTGPNNPKTYGGEDSYQYLPRNPSEIGSYVHDKEYENAGAKGVKGALFNFSQNVIDADIKLIMFNSINYNMPGTTIKEKARSVTTMAAFIPIVGVKKTLQQVNKLQKKITDKF